MRTTVYECGCEVTRSMFGEQQVISVTVCRKHSECAAAVIEAAIRNMAHVTRERDYVQAEIDKLEQARGKQTPVAQEGKG